jgi:predicted sugar kinase
MISNHGEEVDGSDSDLIQVQSVGGSGICGHFSGGIIVNAGKAVPIFRANLPKTYKVIIGIPKSFTHPDSNELMNKELDNMSGFQNTGKEFGGLIAYRLINEAIPGIIQKDYKPCKDLIFDYRWDMGSIKNCSFVCPEIIEIAEKLRPLKNNKDIKFISLSSVGPGFFIITEKPDLAKGIFEKLNMSVLETDIYSDKYKVVERKKWN